MIDWFTVLVQIVNFLILLALLKRFLYQRLLDAMARREEKIQAQVKEAEDKNREAEKLRDEARRQVEELDRQREEKSQQIRSEVENLRRQRMTELRAEIERLREEWRESVRNEQSLFLQHLTREIAGRLSVVARAVFESLANANLENRIIELFLEKAGAEAAGQLKALTDSVNRANGKISISSSFEIDETMRTKIENTLRRVCASVLVADFQIDPELICGIELRTTDYKVVWSIEDYLASLQDLINRAIEEEMHELPLLNGDSAKASPAPATSGVARADAGEQPQVKMHAS